MASVEGINAQAPIYRIVLKRMGSITDVWGVHAHTREISELKARFPM